MDQKGVQKHKKVITQRENKKDTNVAVMWRGMDSCDEVYVLSLNVVAYWWCGGD